MVINLIVINLRYRLTQREREREREREKYKTRNPFAVNLWHIIIRVVECIASQKLDTINDCA